MTKNTSLLAPRLPDTPIVLVEQYVDHSLINEISESLALVAVPENALPAQKYMKSEMPFLGVKAPERRKAVNTALRQRATGSVKNTNSPWGNSDACGCGEADAGYEARTEHCQKDHAKNNSGFLFWLHTSLAMWRQARYREERYAVLDMARTRYAKRFHTIDALPLYEEFVLTGAWWDYVDEISHRATDILVAQPQEMAAIMRQWATCDSVWKRRIAILCQLTRKESTDTQLLEDCINPSLVDDPSDGVRQSDSVEHTAMCKEFFICKAIGWALRDYGRTDPEYVKGYVRKHERRMHSLTIREALKHLR